MAESPTTLASYSQQALGVTATKNIANLFGTQAQVGNAIAALGGETGDNRMQRDGTAIYTRAIQARLDAIAPNERDAFIDKAKNALGENGTAVAEGLKTYFEGKDLADKHVQDGVQMQMEGLRTITQSTIAIAQQSSGGLRESSIAGTKGDDAVLAMGPTAKMDFAVADYAAAMNSRFGGADRDFTDLNLASLKDAVNNVRQHVDALSSNPADLLKAGDAVKHTFPATSKDIDAIAQSWASMQQVAKVMNGTAASTSDAAIDQMMQIAEQIPTAKPRTADELKALREEIGHAAKSDPQQSMNEMISLAKKVQSGSATANDLTHFQDKQIALMAVQTYEAQSGAAAIAQLPAGVQGRNLNGKLSQEMEQLKADVIQDVTLPRGNVTVTQAISGLGFHPAPDEALNVSPPLTTPAANATIGGQPRRL